MSKIIKLQFNTMSISWILSYHFFFNFVDNFLHSKVTAVQSAPVLRKTYYYYCKIREEITKKKLKNEENTIKKLPNCFLFVV